MRKKENQTPQFDEPSEQQAIVNAQLELLRLLAKAAVRMAFKVTPAVDDGQRPDRQPPT